MPQRSIAARGARRGDSRCASFGQSIAFVSMLRNSEPATVSTMSPSILPYSRPSPRLPLHHFSQRRMLASLRRREARRSQGDLEALARGQRFFYLHRFTLCCCMLFTTLRCQPPPHSHLERPIINPIFLEYNLLVPERHGRRPSPWAAKKREKKIFWKYLSQKILNIGIPS